MRKRHSSPWRRFARRVRPFRNRLLICFLECVRVAAGLLPHRTVLWIGSRLGRLGALLDKQGRQIALKQLQRSGMAPDPALARRITNDLFRQLGMNALESLQSLRWTTEQYRERVRLMNPEPLEKARAIGRGVICVSGHMGNWEIFPRAHHAYTGQVLAAVMAISSAPELTLWLIRRREQGGYSRILPTTEALAIMRHLRKGGALAILGDQDSTRSRGIFVDFFGRPAYTPLGPAHLARRTGAPLLPVAIVRDPKQPTRHNILLSEPILADPELDEETDIQKMTQAYTSVLEAWVRQYPEQWVWIHERWRHQPGKKIKVRSLTGRQGLER